MNKADGPPIRDDMQTGKGDRRVLSCALFGVYEIERMVFRSGRAARQNKTAIFEEMREYGGIG